MSSYRNRCPHCGARVDPTLPDCPECHREVPEETLEAAAATPEERARRHRWPIPWGLFIMLGLYFAAVLGYTRYEYVNSPEYKASRHLRIADQLLGQDNGLTAEKEQLVEALDNLIIAMKYVPENVWAQKKVEVLARRLSERKVKLTREQQQLVDALGRKYRVAEDKKTSFMPIGVRDIWDIDALKEMPGRVLQRTFLGGFIIFIVWLYKTLQDRKHMLKLEMERQTGRRKDLREVARPKRRVSSPPSKPSKPQRS